jgi:sugar lactone lactonase YvrE
MKNLLLLLAFIPFIVKGQYITTICGNGMMTNTGDGGPASIAALAGPWAVSVDKSNNIYITCIAEGSRIRKIDASGMITTICGNDSTGFFGDGGPATAGQLDSARQVAFDRSGNIYICDMGNNRIRKINTAGILSTFAGNGAAAYGGDGGPATAAQINQPNGIYFDATGNAYISENRSARIRMINTSGIISTFAGNGTPGYNGDGGPATAAMINLPNRILVIGSDVYFSEEGNNCIRKVDASGIISTFAGDGSGVAGYSGDGGPATDAELSDPDAIAADAYGNFYIADTYNEIIRVINPAGIINTYTGNGNSGYNGDCIADTAAELSSPYGMAVDTSGIVYIADEGNNRIRKITTIGCVSAVTNVSNPGEIFNAFPNPATIELTIKSTIQISQVIILDQLGKNIFKYDYNSEEANIDISGFAPGLYFLKVNGSIFKKFVKE